MIKVIIIISLLFFHAAEAATREKEPIYTKLHDTYVEKSESIFDPAAQPSDNGFVIWERVKTPKGYLTCERDNKNQEDHLFLERKEITIQDHIRLIEVAPEKSSLPSVVVAHMYTGGYDPTHQYEKPHIIDTAVDPVFVSKNYMPIISTKITTTKKDDDTYIFSGPSFLEKGKMLRYIYRRGSNELVPYSGK